MNSMVMHYFVFGMCAAFGAASVIHGLCPETRTMDAFYQILAVIAFTNAIQARFGDEDDLG